MTPWRLAFKELRRNRTRSALMAAAVTVTAVVMTSVLLLVIGVRQGLTQTVNRLGADLMVIPAGEKTARQFNDVLISGAPAEFYFDASILDELANIPGVEAVSAQTFARTLTNASCCAGEFFIVGYDPETDFTIKPWLLENASVPNTEGREAMIVGDRILLDVGDGSVFFGTAFVVTGVLEPTLTGMDRTIYISDKALRKMVAGSTTKAEAPLRIPEDAVSAMFIRAREGADLIDVAETIEQANPDLQAVLSSAVAAAARGQVTTVTALLGSIVAVLWTMAMVLCGVVFSQVVRQRRSEIGLLMAKGADARFILGLLVRESAAIAFGASAIGCGLGLLVILSLRNPLGRLLEIPDVLPDPARGAGLVLASILLLGVAAVTASMTPVMPMFRGDPFESVKGGLRQ